MKEIDKIAFIEIQQGKILSTKSKGKPNIISLEENGKAEKATSKRYTRNSRGIKRHYNPKYS
jgi:hypothetical protein